MAKVTVLSSFPFPQANVLLSLTIIASSIFAVSETNFSAEICAQTAPRVKSVVLMFALKDQTA